MNKMKEIFERMKNNAKAHKKTTITLSIIIFLLIVTGTVIGSSSNKLTPQVFKTEAYTYLPKEAYDYVVKEYEENGIILRTEKNKVIDEPYLNPEYVTYLTKKTKSKYGYVPKELVVDHDYTKDAKTATDLPSKYDSRNVNGKSYITSIKDQGELGLCWDFALTTALEAKILKENLYTGSGEIDLSERQIDYARSNPANSVDIGTNPFYTGYNLNNNLGNGGNIYTYLSAVSQGISPVYESQWTHGYNATGKFAPEDVWNVEKTTYDVDSVYEMPKSCLENYGRSNGTPDTAMINTIKSKIMENGTVTISIAADISTQKRPYVAYIPTGGEQTTGSEEYNILYYKDPAYPYYIDHEITIIGWDDNYEHNVCVDSVGNLVNASYNSSTGKYSCSSGTLKNIKGAWITRNSWGNSLSYPYVAYQTYQSDYETINTVSKRNWENAYTTTMLFNDVTYVKMKTKEKINKIKFSSIDANYSASIYVSTTGDEKDYQLVGTKNITYPGLYTLDLSEQNIVLNNQSFSVKVVNSSTGEEIVTLIPSVAVFTNNVDKDIEIDIKKATYNSSDQYQNLVDKDKVVLLDGTSRNLTSNQRIDFTVKDAEGNDVTNKFSFSRNYEVSNKINTIVGFNNDVEDGIYKVEAKVNNTKYDTFKINVNSEEIPVTKVVLNASNIKLSLTHDKTYKLTAEVIPENATDREVTYTSSNNSVATVDSEGNINSVGVGQATITVRVEDGKYATCVVTVDDSILQGDVTGNGIIDMDDVNTLYNHVKGTTPITEIKLIVAGLFVNTENPNIADVAKLYRIVNGRIQN